MKKCPFCAEEIQDEAVLCRYCQRKLSKSGNHTLVIILLILLCFGMVIFDKRISIENFINSLMATATVPPTESAIDYSKTIFPPKDPTEWWKEWEQTEKASLYHTQSAEIYQTGTAKSEKEISETLIAINRPESWRIPIMGNGKDILTDTIADSSWKAYMEQGARFWAIEKPIRWEIYILPIGTRFSDVSGYYKQELANRGFTNAQDYFVDEEGFGALSFVKAEKRIYVEFWVKNDEGNAQINIIYKNVDTE